MSKVHKDKSEVTCDSTEKANVATSKQLENMIDDVLKKMNRKGKGFVPNIDLENISEQDICQPNILPFMVM